MCRLSDPKADKHAQSTQQSALLALPPELRDMNMNICVVSKQSSIWPDERPLGNTPAITRTNAQLRTEALAIYYSSKHWFYTHSIGFAIKWLEHAQRQTTRNAVQLSSLRFGAGATSSPWIKTSVNATADLRVDLMEPTLCDSCQAEVQDKVNEIKTMYRYDSSDGPVVLAKSLHLMIWLSARFPKERALYHSCDGGCGQSISFPRQDTVSFENVVIAGKQD
jgi:hypothetical protein